MDRVAYQCFLKEQLEELHHERALLKRYWASEKDEMRDEYFFDMEALESYEEYVRHQLKRLEESRGTIWGKVKEQVDQAWNELRDAWLTFKAKMV